MTARDDYVLGTHDDEIDRLGLQHRVWRIPMLEAWRRAGLRDGWRAVDVGAGPGWASFDLADAVGPGGQVLAVERSARFVAALDAEGDRRGLVQLKSLQGDLMELDLPGGNDLAWCRWVASFVRSVPRLVEVVRGGLRPGGVAVFHEYVDYGSWRFAPPRPALAAFVKEVMASWRDAGGEPDVAPQLIGELHAQGFDVRSTRPLVFTAAPGELTWQWPAGFVNSNALRLRSLGRVDDAWVSEVLASLAAAEADSGSVMVTPMVLEIVAGLR